MRRVRIAAAVGAAALLLVGCTDEGPVASGTETFPVVVAAAEAGTEAAAAVYLVITGPDIQAVRAAPDSRGFVRRSGSAEWRIVALGPFTEGRIAELEVPAGTDPGEIVLTIEQVAVANRSLATTGAYEASIPLY